MVQDKTKAICQLSDLKDDLQEIKIDIKEIKQDISQAKEDAVLVKLDLARHISRTEVCENRLELIENKFFDNQDKQYQRFMEIDKANKGFTYKVLTGFVLVGLLPFLLKLLGIMN